MANNNIPAHPYDASINEAVEVGFFSNSDAKTLLDIFLIRL